MDKSKIIGYKSIAVGYFFVMICATVLLVVDWLNTGKLPMGPLAIMLSGVIGLGIARLFYTVKEFK